MRPATPAPTAHSIHRSRENTVSDQPSQSPEPRQALAAHTQAQEPTPWGVPPRLTRLVLFGCWLTILAEGYDVGVIGAVLPAVADDASWDLDPVALGGLAAWALFGMLVGALFIGALSDRLGRKRMLLVSMSLFTLAQLGAALAPTPLAFGLFRFVGGLGMGGVIPVAAALTIEYSPPNRRSWNYGLMYSGYSLGIVVSALTAMALLPTLGWRWVVGLGAAPIILMPLIAWIIPESLESLENRGLPQRAATLATKLGISPYTPALPPALAPGAAVPWHHIFFQLFSRKYLRSTVTLWLALFCGMLLVYGLNSWLPSIMREAGYSLGPALAFLLVFSLSAAAGGLLLGRLSDRFGQKPVLVIWYLLGGIACLALVFPGSMAVNLVFVGISGVGSISTSLVLTGYITDYYPSTMRGTATGWALSFARVGAIMGPMVGGWIAALAVGVEWNFIVFGGVAVLAALLVIAIPKKPDPAQAARLQR